MDSKLKFILILFPIILIGAYFYGLQFETIITGSVVGESIGESQFTIDCPEGFNEITSPISEVPSSENTACVRDSANETDIVTLHCGDEFEEQGTVETVTCSMEV